MYFCRIKLKSYQEYCHCVPLFLLRRGIIFKELIPNILINEFALKISKHQSFSTLPAETWKYHYRYLKRLMQKYIKTSQTFYQRKKRRTTVYQQLRNVIELKYHYRYWKRWPFYSLPNSLLIQHVNLLGRCDKSCVC